MKVGALYPYSAPRVLYLTLALRNYLFNELCAKTFKICTGTLHFLVLQKCGIFYKLRARPFISKKITTHFTAMLALLWRSGPEPTISPRSACNKVRKKRQNEGEKDL